MNETRSGRNNNTLGQTLKQVERAVLSGPRLVANTVKAVWPCDPCDYNHESLVAAIEQFSPGVWSQDVFLRLDMKRRQRLVAV